MKYGEKKKEEAPGKRSKFNKRELDNRKKNKEG